MVLSHSKKSFTGIDAIVNPVRVGVVSRDMYRLSMESCACYQIIGLWSIYIYVYVNIFCV